MAEQVRFGADLNSINVNTEMAQVTSDKAKNVRVDRFDFGKAFDEGAELAVAFKDTQNKVDANQAQVDYTQLVLSPEYRDTNGVGRAELLENFYDEHRESSEAYKASLLSTSASEYARQYEARNLIETNAKYNTMPSYFEASGMDPETFVAQEVAKDPRLNPAQVRDSIILAKFQKWGTDIMSIDIDLKSDDVNVLSKNIALAEQQLGDALKQIEEEKKPFQNPKFLTTKEKKAQAMVEQEERALMLIVKQKQEEIKEAHYAIRALAVQSGYRGITPEQMAPHIDATSPNSYTAMKDKKDFTEKFEERKEADLDLINNPIGQRKGPSPHNSLVKEERPKLVTATLMNLWNKGDVVNFVRIADNEEEYAKDMGTIIVKQFNSAKTTEELEKIQAIIKQIEVQPSGARVLRTMISDDEYIRMKKLEQATILRPTEDLVKLRAWVDQKEQTIGDVPINPDDWGTYIKRASSLGDQGIAYLNMMKHLNSLDPKQAKEKEAEVYKKFKGNIKTVNGVQVDTSFAPSPADASLNPELAEDLIDEQFVNKPSKKVYFKGGIVMAVDEFAGQVELRKVTDVNEVVDRLEMEKAKRSRKTEEEGMDAPVGSWERIKASAKSSFRNMIRTSTDTASKGLASVKDVYNKLEGFVKGSGNEEKHIPLSRQEKITDIEAVQKELVVERPIDFDKLPKQQQLQIDYAIEKNKVQYNILNRLKEQYIKGER